MRRPVFWSLFGPQLVILLLCILVLAGYSWKSRRAALSGEWRRVLDTQAVLVSHLVLDDEGGLHSTKRLNALGERLMEESGVRLTVLTPDGRVLFDSVASSDEMLLHADRPEIIGALHGGERHSERYSKTLGQVMHYAAYPVRDRVGGTLAVVRVAIPRHEIVAPLERFTRFFAGMLALVILASVGFSYLLARRVTIPVRDMLAGLLRLGSGDLSHRLAVPRPRHLATLSEAINETGEQLSRQVGQIKAERALREGILSGMHEGVVALDRERRIVLINPAARALLETGTRPVAGQPLELTVPNIGLLELVDAAAKEGKPLTGEIRWREKRHTESLLLATATRWQLPDGEEGGLLILLSDMTRIRRIEQIRRDFVANVSHELRTPITSIRGFTETLMDAPPEDEETRQRFLGIILRQTEQMQTILNDMLLLARLEEDGGAGVKTETVSAAALLESSCEVCLARARASNVTLVREVPQEFTFQGHRHLLEQALVNLIDNAIKYGGAGKHVIVKAALRNQTVSLAVHDQGPGLHPEQAGRVFERFYRVDAGRSREQGGSGLGLAVVKHVVQAHRGTVTVENLPQGGCAFIIALPLVVPVAEGG